MSKFSRRKLMAACAGAMLSKMPLGAAQEPSVPVAAIDIHHHMLPPFYKPAVLEWLGRLGGRSAAIDQWTPERSIAALDEAAKARAVLSISTPAVTLENRRAAIEMAHRCNDYGAELSERYPDRLAFFATLPMPDVDASLGELERSSKLPRAAGAVLLTSYDGRYLGEPAFDPLFEELDRRRALVFVHPTAAPCCFGLTPEIGTALIELPVDTGRAVASLLWAGTLSRYPRIRFVFSHGGGILPMLTDRLKLVGVTSPAAAARVPQGVDETLRRLYVDTASVANRAAMAAARSLFGEEHILFGSDYPWGFPAPSLAALQEADFSEDALGLIKYGNARALLGSVFG